MTDFVLRPLRKSDYADLVALWRGADDSVAGVVADLADGRGSGEAGDGRAEQAVLRALAAERTIVVAELDDRIAGFVVVDLPAARVDRLVAAPGAAAEEVEADLADAARGLMPGVTAMTGGATGDGRWWHPPAAVGIMAGAA